MIPNQIHKNHEIHRIPRQNNENQENLLMPRQDNTNQEILIKKKSQNKKNIKIKVFQSIINKNMKYLQIPCQNYENHENSLFHSRIPKII